MKETIKRSICLMLVLTLVLSLAACAKPAQPTDPSDSGSTPATDPNPTESTGTVFNPEDEYKLPLEDGYNQVTFYWDYTDNMETSSFWIWPEGGNGKGYLVYPSAFGSKCVVNVPEDVTSVGFIACYNCSNPGGDSWVEGTKDGELDRYVTVTGKETFVYLKFGDGNIYFSDDGGKTLYMDKKIKSAGIASFSTIKYELSVPTRITALDQIQVFEGDRQVAVTELTTLNNNVNHGQITLAENVDLSKTYTLQIDGYGTRVALPTTVFDSEEFLANFVYDGDDLGAVIQPDGSTTFKVWAPTASAVVLNLYSDGHTESLIRSVDMVKEDRGVWMLNVADAGHGTYYTYTVTTSAGTQQAVDPYARAAGVNGDRGMVVDLSRTDPADWEKDQVVTLKKYTDATIWEIHVRDFSNKIGTSKYPGKYLAFTERGLTNSAGVRVGVDYLLDLGVTHLHLLPVYDYASVDETKCDSFNWGYDPENYNVPEGSYSTDPYNGEVRINEFKQMVQSLHADGLGVIMDVVYNHTYDANSSFNKIVPNYYYRYTSGGDNSNGSGCGNDTASERYMFRKFMVDSVSYWAEEYNLDGFRFDLMGLHDIETMQQIEQAVHAINPNAIIYGEAWTLSTNPYGNAILATQANIKKIVPTEGAAGGVAVFNDAIRDGLKGSVFEKTGTGYINGSFAQNTAKVQFGIAGGSTTIPGWSVKDAMVINYMSAHDNNTLWDKLLLSNPNDSVADRLAMNRLGAAIMLMSQGTPFWQAGEEMLRTKGGDENSYMSSDAVNNLDWEALVPDSDVYSMMRYYKGLIELRSAYEIFRSSDSTVVSFGSLPGGGMVVTYRDASGNEALMLVNPAAKADSYTLDAKWKLVADSTRAGSQVISTESGEVSVDARSVLIFVK